MGHMRVSPLPPPPHRITHRHTCLKQATEHACPAQVLLLLGMNLHSFLLLPWGAGSAEKDRAVQVCGVLGVQAQAASKEDRDKRGRKHVRVMHETET